MKRVTHANFRTDPHYSRVVRAVNDILSSGHVVAPVDVFVRMALLGKDDLESWRFGRVPYLERVVRCNLSKAERILRLICLHAEARGLKPSHTTYQRFGTGPKQPLRFSRFAHVRLEELYSIHFVRPNPQQHEAIGESSSSPPKTIAKPGNLPAPLPGADDIRY